MAKWNWDEEEDEIKLRLREITVKDAFVSEDICLSSVIGELRILASLMIVLTILANFNISPTKEIYTWLYPQVIYL